MGRPLLIAALALSLTAAPAAHAADAVTAEAVRANGYSRISFVWPDSAADAPLSAETTIENQVLVVRFSREVTVDLDPILNAFSAEIALARLDPDQRTLRLALRAPARTHVSRSYNVLAVDLLPPEADDPPDVISPRAQAEAEAARRREEEGPAEPVQQAAAPLLPLTIRRATSPAFDRIVFAWPEQTDYSLGERGGQWELRFSRDAEPNLGPLRADLPPRLRGIEASHDDDSLVIAIDPAPGVSPRAFRERNDIILDLTDGGGGDAALLAQLEAMAERAAADAAAAEQPETESAAADIPETPPTPESVAEAASEPEAPAEPDGPVDLATFDIAPETPAAPPAPTTDWTADSVSADAVPASGVVEVRGSPLGGDLMMEFQWEGPVRAAAFRRAGAIWIVFDAEAQMDVSEIGRGQRHVTDIQTFAGSGYSAVRVLAPEATQISARPEPGPVWSFVLADRVETGSTPIRIERRLEENGSGRLFAVMANPAPPIRLPDPGVGDTLIVTPAPRPAQGVLDRREYLNFSILPSAQGLAIQSLTDMLLTFSDENGVWITPPQGLSAGRTAPAGGGSAALIAFTGPKTGEEFAQQESAIERRAAADDSANEHIRLARFDLQHEMAPEALGALDLALDKDPELISDPGYRALRGVAHTLAGRYDEATRDLSQPALLDDETAQLWLGVAKAELGAWREAREAFGAGQGAIDSFPGRWRAVFHEAFGRTALELGDLAAAKDHLDKAEAEAAPREQALRIALLAARWRQAAGEIDAALSTYDRLSTSGDEWVEARALLHAAELRRSQGLAEPAELIDMLEALRWRWRGDEVELETIRTLGKLYVAQGETRQGLEAMQAAVARFPDSATSRAVFSDMMDIFADLFLNGGADQLDPVEAVALYFQFSELTPIGSEGDRMIRRLSERLVAFDLLPQAAELLQHQVDQRLHEPQAKASVAADLALIYLMDRRPEQALRTLRATRLTRLPPDLAAERRIIEGRALAELEAFDAALDLVAGDPSVEAARLRADIAWRRRDWAMAGQRLEEVLGDRWNADIPLDDGNAATVLRAAVAYSLARDREGLDRLAERFGQKMGMTPHSAAFAVVTQELETSGLRLAEIADRAADTAALEAFLDRRRDRLEFSGDEMPEASEPVYEAPETGAQDIASAQ